VADHALVLHAPVLAAGALPVLLRPENALAEQAVLLRTVGAVVDGLGLLDLAEGPAADVVRARQADAYGAVVVDAVVVHFTGIAHGDALLKGHDGSRAEAPPPAATRRVHAGRRRASWLVAQPNIRRLCLVDGLVVFARKRV